MFFYAAVKRAHDDEFPDATDALGIPVNLSCPARAHGLQAPVFALELFKPPGAWQCAGYRALKSPLLSAETRPVIHGLLRVN